MDPYEIIKKKRDGRALSQDEIKEFVHGFTDERIPDYQMSAWLMALWFNGMNSRERADLTREMVETGSRLSYPRISKTLVDKHSTGGVGDGVSLSLVPLVASLDVKVPMMSGRGLGHTGGTLDKLESIPGFEVYFDQDEINQALTEIGALIMGQTDDIAPADGKMYSLRDVTATIDSVDLIASSIMSKKIAEGMDALVLDVKTGSGAFMEEFEESLDLARSMIEIGRELGKDMQALITDMNQPLGRAVGNAIEMKQAIDVMKGEGPADLTKLVTWLAGSMLYLADKADSRETGQRIAERKLSSGDALRKLKEMIQWQNGDPAVLEDETVFPEASYDHVVEADQSGFVKSINAFEVGMSARMLGAGRETMDDVIDHAAGLYLHKKVGDPVEIGDPIAELHCNDESDLKEARERLEDAIEFTNEPVEPDPLIQAVVQHDGTENPLNVSRS